MLSIEELLLCESKTSNRCSQNQTARRTSRHDTGRDDGVGAFSPKGWLWTCDCCATGKVRDDVRDIAVEHVGDAYVMLVVDETGGASARSLGCF